MANKLYRILVSQELVICDESPEAALERSKKMTRDSGEHQFSLRPVDDEEDLPLGWTVDSVPFPLQTKTVGECLGK